MSEKRLRSFLFPALLLFLLFCACLLLLSDLIQRPSFQQYLIGKISEASGLQIEIDSFDISILRGFEITAHGLSAASVDGKTSIRATRAGIGLGAGALLKGHIVPTRLSLDNPVIVISPKVAEKGKSSGLEQILAGGLLWKAGFVRSLNIMGGVMRVEGWPYHFREIDLHMGVREDVDGTHYFRLRCSVGFKNRYLPWSLQGTLKRDPQGAGLLADISGESGEMVASWIPWPNFVAFSKGEFGVKFHVTGILGEELSADGEVIGQDLHFAILRGSRRKAYEFCSIPMSFSASLDKRNNGLIRISNMKVLKSSLDARIEIHLDEKPSPRLELSITAPSMPLQTFKALFPTSLVPAWIEEKLFPILAEGKVETTYFRLSGSTDVISHMGRPENFHALSMKLNWSGLKALEHEVASPFRAVSGVMEIRDNRLLLSSIKGRFGRSTIHQGNLEVHPLVGGPPRYDAGLKGAFLIEDLLTMKGLPWTPPPARELLAGLAGSSGPLSVGIKLFRKPGGSTFRVQEALLNLEKSSLVHKALFFPLKVKAAVVKIAKAGPARFSGDVTWGGSAFRLAGMSEQSAARGYAKVTGLVDIDELAAEATEGRIWDIRLGKPASCNVNIKKEKNKWGFNGTLDLKKGPGLKVGPLSFGSKNQKNALFFSANYYPGKAFVFSNLNGEFGRSVFTASGSLALSRGRTLKVDLRSPGLFLKDLGIRLNRKGTSPEGFLRGNIEASIPLNDPVSSDITGNLEALHLYLPLKGLVRPLKEGYFSAVFSGKEISISSLGFKMGKSGVKVHGKLTDRRPLLGKLIVQSDFLDTTDFYKKESGGTSKGLKAAWRYLQNEKTDLEVSATLSHILWRKMKLGPFTAQCGLKGGDFHLTSSSVKMKHGILSTAGDIIKSRDNQISLLSHIRFFRQPVQDLVGSFSTKPSFIEGRLSADAVLSTKGTDKASLIAALQGKGQMLIEKGKIHKSNILIQVMDFLSLQKIFRRPPPDLSKKGFYFDEIGCDFVVKKGLLNTEDLVMKSPVFNGAIRGRLDLNNSQIKADLHVQPLVTMDSLVSKIPIIGYILTGKDKTLLVYYFRVKGPAAEPEVSYVPLKHWGNSIMGYATRAFLTPPRLFKKLREMVNPPEN